MTDVQVDPLRIKRLPEDEWDEPVREILSPWRGSAGGGTHVPNNFATLARHPAMLRAWEPFAGAILLRGELPPRDRELAVIRTALHCRAAYVWGSHVRDHGPEIGLTGEDIERIVEGPTAAGWTDLESAVLQATDELHRDARIHDATWARLAAGYTEPQLIELPMLVGEYHLMAYTFNSLGVEAEDGFPPLPPLQP